MYVQHFRLNEIPFSLTPNTQFFLGLTPHLEALQVLQTALQTGEGFIKVTGEVGTGKTLICRKLINDLPSNYRVAYIPNPYLSPDEFRWALAQELGVEFDKQMDQQQLGVLLQKQLFQFALEGCETVLVIDESQAIPDETLEALRLLTNFETETRKLLQVVLFGQPELDARLQLTRFRQLKQRITFSYRLRQLTASETLGYLNHRLNIAGYQGVPLFTLATAKLINKASQGVPRLINIISHKTLLLCYGEGRDKIKLKHVYAAIADCHQDAKCTWLLPMLAPLFKPLLIALGMIGLATLGWFLGLS